MTNQHAPTKQHYRNITIIAFILILIIAGGVVWYMTLGKDLIKNSTGSGSIPPGLDNPDTNILTADWKSRMLAEFGVSLKYPGDWTYREVPARKNQTVLYFAQAGKTLPEENSFDYNDILILQVLDLPASQVIDNQSSLESLSRSQVLRDTTPFGTRIQGVWPRDSLYSEAVQNYFVLDLGDKKTLLLGLQQKKNASPDMLTIFNNVISSLQPGLK